MIPKGITPEEYLEAVKLGVREAILITVESGDSYSMRDRILSQIHCGVITSFPPEEDICQMIKDGVYNAIKDSELK